MERHLKAWVEYDKRVEQYMQNRMRLYGVLWGQCTTAMRHKLMEDEEYNVWSRSKNTLKLWVTIKTLSLEDRGPSNQNAFKRADDAMVAFQKIRQYASEKIGDFYDRFLTEVDAAELCGVDFRNPAQAEQICEKLRKLLLVRKKKEQQHRMQAHAQVLQQQAAAAAAARRAQEEAREQESEEAQAKPLGRHRAKMTMPVRDAGEMEETSYSSRSEPARASVHQVPPSVQQVPLNLPDPVITTDEESEIKEEALLKSRDQQLAMIFLNKLDTKRYGSMLAEWENRLNDGDDVCPQTLIEAFRRVSNRKVDTRSGVVGTQGVAFVAHGKPDKKKSESKEGPAGVNQVRKLDSKSEKTSEDKCWFCEKPGHRRYECEELKKAYKALDKKGNKETVILTMGSTEEDEDDFEFGFVINDEPNMPTVYYSKEVQRHANSLDPFDILCDNQATVSVFHQTSYLKNIRQADRPIRLSGIGGSIRVEQVGDFGNFGVVYFHPQASDLGL